MDKEANIVNARDKMLVLAALAALGLMCYTGLALAGKAPDMEVIRTIMIVLGFGAARDGGLAALRHRNGKS